MYAEYYDPSGMIVGLLGLFLIGILFYVLFRPYIYQTGIEKVYCAIENKALRNFAKKKFNFDMNKVFVELDYVDKKSFRKRLENELIDEYFKEKEDVKK